MLYQLIDSFARLLRRNIRKDSWLWRRLSAARRFIASLRHNPISRRKWIKNHDRFEKLIDLYSRETGDFFVLQVGACDGVVDDPIQHFVKKYDWHGILVEPQVAEFERLKANYRDNAGLAFENVAIAETNGTRTLYKVKDEKIESDWQRSIASFLPKPSLEKRDMVTTEEVQCITFDALLNRHQVTRIDLLQIDVEGYDYKLLQLFDFDRIKPRLIRYEHRHLGLSDRSACRKFLMRRGYQILEMKHDSGAVFRRQEAP